MIIIFSYQKDNLGRYVKVLINSLGIKAKKRLNQGQRNKKTKACHCKCQYEGYLKSYPGVWKLPFKGYVWKRLKHERTDSYFNLSV